MANFTANEVFWHIKWIAHSMESLEGRCLQAVAGIDEFIADLVQANLQPGEADKIVGQLKAKLESAVIDRTAGGSIESVFRAALGRLTVGHR